ncbi:MAG: hypothetical protein U0795_25895 [Pirellulales bacterium]
MQRPGERKTTGKAAAGGDQSDGQLADAPAVKVRGLPALLIRRHLGIGWWGLLIFLTLGIVLELLHSFKFPGYLAPGNGTRRLLWTLAHSHGTLFSLIHIAFAATLTTASWMGGAKGGVDQQKQVGNLSWASRCLTGALVLMPLGFFAGGWGLQAGDPGWGIFLAPVGAALLLIGVGLTLVVLGQNWS